MPFQGPLCQRSQRGRHIHVHSGRDAGLRWSRWEAANQAAAAGALLGRLRTFSKKDVQQVDVLSYAVSLVNEVKNGRENRHCRPSPCQRAGLAIHVLTTSASPDPHVPLPCFPAAPAEHRLIVASSDKTGVIGKRRGNGEAEHGSRCPVSLTHSWSRAEISRAPLWSGLRDLYLDSAQVEIRTSGDSSLYQCESQNKDLGTSTTALSSPNPA